MGEHLACTEKVAGSIPVASTSTRELLEIMDFSIVNDFLGLDLPSWAYWLVWGAMALTFWNIIYQLTSNWKLAYFFTGVSVTVLVIVGVIPIWISIVVNLPIVFYAGWALFSSSSEEEIPWDEEIECQEGCEDEEEIEQVDIPSTRHWRKG